MPGHRGPWHIHPILHSTKAFGVHSSPPTLLLRHSSSASGKPRTALGVPNHTEKTPANPASKKPRTPEPVGARPIKRKAPSMNHFDRRDSGRVSGIVWPHSPLGSGAPVAIPAETLSVPSMPFPTSPQSLYRNLLFITSSPQFCISKAINYYFDWPKALHSPKSFNLLISLALRSASFASVGRLFGAMRAEAIPPNLETHKLHVRWLVRTGKWTDAWKRVLEVTGHRNVSLKLPNGPIPLPLWLELFGSQMPGALRHWVITDQKPSLEAASGPCSKTIPGAGLEGGLISPLNSNVEDADSASPRRRKRLVPRPYKKSHAVELSRYRALMQVSPLLTSSDQVRILPRTILIVTQTMHRVGQRALAFATALAYLKSLPPHLRRCDRRRLLDLVNFHLSVFTWHRKAGLKQHFSQRRILWKFLQARPDLTPSSTTLFLLLGPLRSCRRGGTLAMQCLLLFRKRWGPRVQSRLVRRRVTSLALKEGRLDIVEAMLRLEWRRKVSDDAVPRAACTSRRRPWRILFCRRGAENRRWHLMEQKYRRRVMLKSQSWTT